MPASGSPNTRTEPELGANRPAATFSSVLLPQPVGPTTETNSPAATVRSTSRTAVYDGAAASRLANVHATPLSSRAVVTVFFLPNNALHVRACRPARFASPVRVLRVGLLGELVRVDGRQVELGTGDLGVDAGQRAIRRVGALVGARAV